MTEKNIFVYKLLLSLHISDFIFYVKTATPLKKVSSLLISNLPLKIEILSSPPFRKIWLVALNPPQQKEGGGGGVQTMQR